MYLMIIHLIITVVTCNFENQERVYNYSIEDVDYCDDALELFGARRLVHCM